MHVLSQQIATNIKATTGDSMATANCTSVGRWVRG